MRTPIQRYGARALVCLGLLLFVAAMRGTTTLDVVAPFIDDLRVQSAARTFFRTLDDPSPLRFEVWAARSMLVTACVFVPVLLLLIRWRNVASESSAGLGARILTMRVLGPLVFLAGAAIGAAALLAQAHYGLAGDSPAMWPRFELCAHVTSPDRETLSARTDYHTQQPDGSLRFTFPADAPLREMRVSGVRRPDAPVELVLARDPSKTIRILERECASATGDLKQEERRLLTRVGPVAVGELHLECPAQGVAAHVSVVPGASDQALEKFGRQPSMWLVRWLFTYAVALLVAGMGLLVQGFGARTDPGTGDSDAERVVRLVPTVFLALPLLFTAPKVLSPAFGYDRTYTPPHVTGCVHVAHAKHTHAIGKPTYCSAGHRRGHDLVTLRFSHGSPVRELQIAIGQDGDRAVEAHLANAHGSPLFFGRNQCTYFETTVETRSYTINRTPREHTSGDIHMSCPSVGIELHASLENC